MSLTLTTNQLSANIHVIDKIALRLLNLFPIVILVVSTVGAQITFSIILSDIADPTRLDPLNSSLLTPASFDKETVRCLISISWLLFIFVVFASFGAAVLLIFHEDDINQPNGYISTYWLLRLMGIAVLIILEIITFGAFMCLGLAVAAYVKIVGWVAVGCIILGALLTFATTAWYIWEYKNDIFCDINLGKMRTLRT